jgi:hypothetical protein
VLEAPNPTSSSKTRIIFGAPLGGLSCLIGGKWASAFFASYTISPLYGRSGIGRTERSILGEFLVAIPASDKLNTSFLERT